jgi:N-terminal domain of reverse transcriptase/Reverse transcriptase (RNA-dependent DNA polymerase)
VMIFTERTEEQTHNPWADIAWHAVQENVRRLQERIYRATTEQNWRQVKNLQKLLARATSNQLLAIRRVTQENQGKRTAGVDGVVCDTPRDRLRLFRSGLTPRGHRPLPVRRVYIPKANGKQRPLGIPTVKDRVLQAMVKAALEPEWEAKFEANSYGFRPGRGVMDAIEALHTTLSQPGSARWILDADISGCFDNIDQTALLSRLPVFTTTLRRWLKAGVVEGGQYTDTEAGTPQGGTISPYWRMWPWTGWNVSSAGKTLKVVRSRPRTARAGQEDQLDPLCRRLCGDRPFTRGSGSDTSAPAWKPFSASADCTSTRAKPASCRSAPGLTFWGSGFSGMDANYWWFLRRKKCRGISSASRST